MKEEGKDIEGSKKGKDKWCNEKEEKDNLYLWDYYWIEDWWKGSFSIKLKKKDDKEKERRMRYVEK